MNTDNKTDTTEPRKRPRVEAIVEAKDEGDDPQHASETGTETETEENPATPAYGSQEYWDDRYKNKPVEQASSSEDAPDPYHAWYFKFEDLAPLLLPLILGDDGDDDDGAEEYKEDKDDDDSKKNKIIQKVTDCENQILSQPTDAPTLNRDQTKLASQRNNENLKEIEKEENKNEDTDLEQIECDNENDEGESEIESGEESEDFEFTEIDDDDDEDSVMIRVGLAKNGPISVLEIGCGDAPLGRDLALSLQEYGTSNGRDPSTIIQKVICLDYSKNVIDTMKEEQQLQNNAKEKEKRLPIHYEEADARKLSYRNESFEMILEKGTLDAMLSDSEGSGQKNCRKIVSECARVVTIGGYIIIISHLNARVDSGLQWLNDVVVPGLRAAGNFEWLVEVHGSDIDIPSDDEDDNDKLIESPGPAVYFIEKVGITTTTKNSDGSEPSPPTIPLKFVSY